MFDHSTILITGGTGSLGVALAKTLLPREDIKKVIVFSRDEWKQHQMEHDIPHEKLRFFIGDVRDLPRLERSLTDVDIVIHAAALKQVPAMEYNPYEAVKTNVLGTQNLIEAAIDKGVKKVLLVSTDKAVHPVNLYGATKLCAEKLIVAGNSYAAQKTLFSAVRYGNVLASRGSVVETVRARHAGGVKIPAPAMTRFWITLMQAVELVRFALEKMEGGEIFVPKIPSMRLSDLIAALAPDAKQEVIGIRPGEKLHEILLTEQESRHAFELANHYVILPEFVYFAENLYAQYHTQGKPLPVGFRYTSDTNTEWLTKEKLLQVIRK